MAFKIPQWQGCRNFVSIVSHVIAWHTGVQSASWYYCLGSGSSHSSGLLQVSLRGSIKCHTGLSVIVPPFNFFNFHRVCLRQEHGQQSYISSTNLSISNKGLYNSLFGFQAKPFPIFPGWVFLCEGECELGAACCIYKRVEVSSIHLDFRKVLFDLSFEVPLASLPFEELLFGLMMLHLEFTQKKTHCWLSLGVLSGFWSSCNSVKKKITVVFATSRRCVKIRTVASRKTGTFRFWPMHFRAQ